MKVLLKRILDRLGYTLEPSALVWADPERLEKASSDVERFREIISDPLNLLISRVPAAGYVDKDGCVILHNGNRVPLTGPSAYYDKFSQILVLNRGVHEPLEEYCFQQMLVSVDPKPVMLEVGAYWAHYSMWLKKARPEATCIMIEPDAARLKSGIHNFSLNGYTGEFIQAAVSADGFRLDQFVAERRMSSLDVLHADVQRHEVGLLMSGREFLSGHGAKYIFVSTHSEALHHSVEDILRRHSYRVEVSSGFATHTTACDGFIMATSPHVSPLFESFKPLGRVQIAQASPEELVHSIAPFARAKDAGG